MSSISSVKNLPANAIKISAVILNLASDKPGSDKNRKRSISRFFLTVAYEHCVTIKQTVIRAGRRVKKKYLTTKKVTCTNMTLCLATFHVTIFWLGSEAFGSKIYFFKFLLPLNSQKRLEYKTPLIKYRSLSWKAQIHVRILIQYIDRGLSVVVLNGCLLALSESYFFISLVPWCQGGA